jgi:hypothetical protein
MTPLIAIFSVLVLLGCLRMQLARSRTVAKSSRDSRDACEFARVRTPTRPGIAAEAASYQNR